MKKTLLVLFLLFISIVSFSQDRKGAKFIHGGQFIVKTVGTGSATKKYRITVGMPIYGKRSGTDTTRVIKPLDIRFPWDILYLYDTFGEDYFTVSKGYFGDKVKIEWELKNNISGSSAVTGLKIFRRVYNPVNPNSWGNPIANLAATSTSFEDKYIEGGILYEYKLYANGVNSTELKYRNFITGIGFRSPTAIVTGNINFKGGNPVKDVLVQANSKGGFTSPLIGLQIPESSDLAIKEMKNGITNALTMQAWLKPTSPFINDQGNPIRVFRIRSSTEASNTIDVFANLKLASKILEITIGGRVYQISNYFPSGKTDDRGNDELIPVSEFNTQFTHLSVVVNHGNVPTLYINGRPISAAYRLQTHTNLINSKVASYTAPYFAVSVPTSTISLTLLSQFAKWNDVFVGGNNSARFDEIRIWNKAVDTAAIRTDYKRYISGNQPSLISYLSLNEGAGEYAYDLSRSGFDYNENNGILGVSTTWVRGTGNTPSTNQLGILGVTDEKGNYEITNIPYSGTGESYTITPMFGQHKFEPNQQLVFLGQGSEVANKIDFRDVSSFSFKGKVLYDSRGVFPSFVAVNAINNPTNKFNSLTPGIDYVEGGARIQDSGYNNYQIVDQKYSKGEFWKNTNGTASTDDDYLERYSSIFVEGANVYVDGVLQLDANNLPVETTKEGRFDISVPIGNHAITVKKEGHTFTFNGRYPAAPGTFQEFFEDSNEPVVFIDSTKIQFVGKVVGGPIEAVKKIGFGQNGLLTREIKSDSVGNKKILEVSAKNNIGVARFKLEYGSGQVPPTQISTFQTNVNSGEFRVNLLPLLYKLEGQSSITIPTQTDISLIGNGTSETLDFTKIVPKTTPVFKYKSFGDKDSTVLNGEPYHYAKNYIYRSTPLLKVLKQTSDEIIKVAGVEISTANFATPIYTQFFPYEIDLQRIERYLNKDVAPVDTNNVPIADGQLIASNTLALSNTEVVTTDAKDPSILHYSFKAGIPNIAPPFRKTIGLFYRVNNSEIPVTLKSEGIILGGASDGSQTFVTEAPDVPAIILRDPPGTNSSASIEKGTVISFNTRSSFGRREGGKIETEIGGGTYFELQGGLVPTPRVSIENKQSLDIGLGFQNTTTDGKNMNTSYSFNKTISTSSEPDYVGSEGDLYIGNSKNIYYGSYDNMVASRTIPQKYVNGIATNLSPNEYIVLGTSDFPIYISKQKALSYIDKPLETFFIYSQKHILNTLIPEYTLAMQAIKNGPNPESAANLKLLAQKAEQIRLWKKVIFDNEKSKYLAKNDRAKYKEGLLDQITAYQNKLKTALDGVRDPLASDNIEEQIDDSDSIRVIFNTQFEKNISFDAGLGEYSQSVRTNVINTTTTNYNVIFDQSVATKFGFSINKIGISTKTSAFFQQDINSAMVQEYAASNTITYRLKDNDPANFLSVDVVNSFDRNGPIFSVLGGRTSCPYEGAETSEFFPESVFKEHFDKVHAKKAAISSIETQLNEKEKAFNLIKITGSAAAIGNNRKEMAALIATKNRLENELTSLDSLIENSFDKYVSAVKAPLNKATQKVEVPELNVTKDNIINVPEAKKAEFELKLRNNSTAGVDADFKLVVDNTTNPNNALINIEQNGTIVHVPYGQTVIYKLTLGKSISDVYNYNNIKIRLESLCDGVDVSSSVVISAQFVPACTDVEVSNPLGNWVYNKAASPNKLTVNVSGFNANFASFKQIDLEYRASGSANWTRLQTYFNNETLLNSSSFPDKKSMIAARASLPFEMDVLALNLADGNYEIRARSSCTNNTTYISDPITGKIDLNAPIKFNAPLPIDGILGAGEDIKVSFNEPIIFSSGTSLVKIEGQTNQLKINHDVSLLFEGTNNTMVINQPKIMTGDLTLEFWLKLNSTANATILKQNDGIKIDLIDGKISFTIGGIQVQGSAPTDGLFHHYTFVYKNKTGEVSIFRDALDPEIKTGEINLPTANNEAIILGGNTFKGNLHDLRIWNKTISQPDAYANRETRLSGNEPNLIGFWPMDEGNGTIAYDKARFKHAEIKTNWDIKPRGTAYSFANKQHLSLENVSSVQLTKEMDATISFWIKTEGNQEATIFSNGKGNGTDITQSDGFDNKWAINLTTAGNLTFNSEGKQLVLTTTPITDNLWHHVSILLNRQGALTTYVDAAPVSANLMTGIGGFSGGRIWLGARGSQDLAGYSVDHRFTGKLDEFQLWNTLRNEEQIKRDRFFEVSPNSIGLLLYARMNQPTPASSDGPRYYHAIEGNKISTSLAVVRTDTTLSQVNFSVDAPAVKPERSVINFEVNRVISNTEMILEPVISDIASLEGQMVDITVHRMFDAANNAQASPITWTAFYRRHEISWFAEGYNEIVDIVKPAGEANSFEITLLNKGGKTRPFTITNIPRWLSLSRTTGSIAADSKLVIIATIDKDYTPGEYIENLHLQTDFNYDEKLQVKVRVLAKEPSWNVNAANFDKSMTLVGRIQVNGVFSNDVYDLVAAFQNGKLVGTAKPIYNEAYKQYFIFLTLYSSDVTTDKITFKIWDASAGKIVEATANGELTLDFQDNDIRGSLSSPVLLANTSLFEQNIALNKGWTWVSMNVDDPNFSNLNTLTKELSLETDDRIVAGSKQEIYSKNIAIPTWSGSISSNGGISSSVMYKMYLNKEQTLNIKGAAVDISTWTFPVKKNWNWLPFPLPGNRLLSESMAYFDAVDGDVIKSQTQFAIFDPILGWNGSMKYLESGKGYMLKSSKDQTFRFPSYLAKNMGVAKPVTGLLQVATTVPFEAEKTVAEFNQYSQNMNAVVSLPSGYTDVFVYDEAQVLKAKASRSEDKELVYLTIFGEKPENLFFYISNGGNKQKATASVKFEANRIIGAPANPFVLELAEGRNVQLYPNPFASELTIELNASVKQESQIEIISLTGQVIYTQAIQVQAGTNVISCRPLISNGIYLVRVQIDGREFVQKVIKQADTN